MPAIIQSHTTGEGRSGIVGGYVRPTSDHQTKGGARTALDTLFQSIIDGPWFTRYVGCGLIYSLLVDQHRDSKGLGGVGTCGGDGAICG